MVHIKLLMFVFIVEHTGKGTSSYVFSSKGKQNEGKSKIKPAPIEVRKKVSQTFFENIQYCTLSVLRMPALWINWASPPNTQSFKH